MDGLLFESGGWFVLDDGNRRVPGVRPTSLSSGLGMVGQGRVATLVGRLREGVRAVDVDLVGERGHAVVEQMAGWCRRAGVWHVVRPSGGADGRAHLFVVAGDRVEGLEAEVAAVRDRFGVSPRMVDLRAVVRPLSAPHRRGGRPAPLGDPERALSALRRALRRVGRPEDPTSRPSPDVRARVEPLEPRRQRHARELPPEWATYLATGRRPQLRADARDRSGSTFEYLATARMLQAGWTAQQAWTAIAAAHPAAMRKARGSWSRWVTAVWNRVVATDDDHHAASDPPAEVAAAVAAAREALRALAWSTPTRQRAGLLIVGHAVLDRMERTGQTRVPVPERDLVLDTGIRDRATIRGHLHRLHDAIGTLHQCFDPAARSESSHELEIPQAGGLTQIPPPSFHTPGPADLPPGLPRMTWPLLRTLPREPTTVEDLAVAAQVTGSPTADLSERQRRTVTTMLSALGSAGLAECDEQGRWRRTDRGMTAAARQEATRARRDAATAVHAERDAYRSGRPGRGRWQAQRAAAIKTQRAKQAAWWDGLFETDRTERTERMQVRFAALSIQQQYELKMTWARRDAAADIDPAQRHAAWLAAQSAETFAQRSIVRQAEFARLPHPVQIAAVHAWQDYRRAWHVSRPPSAPDRTSPPARVVSGRTAKRDGAVGTR